MKRSPETIANDAKVLGQKLSRGEALPDNVLQILAAYVEELAEQVAEMKQEARDERIRRNF